MKTPKKPQQVLKEIADNHGLTVEFNQGKLNLIYEAMTAYHEQFVVTPSEIDSSEIFKWLNNQGYQKEQGEQYMMYFDVDMPKILNNWANHIKKAIPNTQTITPSERERQIAIAFFRNAPRLFNQGHSAESGFDEFSKSDAYKAIPPAETMPSREEAEKSLLDIYLKTAPNDRCWQVGAMAMYDYLTSTENKEA